MSQSKFFVACSYVTLSACCFSVYAGVSNYLFKKTLFPDNGFYAGLGVGGGETYAGQFSNRQILPNGTYNWVTNSSGAGAFSGGTVVALTGGTVTSVRQSMGIAWLLNAGYQFNPYFAVQFDYFRFRSSHLNLNETFNVGGAGAVTGTARVSKYAFDIVMRGMFEAGHTGIHLYGKAGLGVLRQKINNVFYQVAPQVNIGSLAFQTDATSVTFGAGAVYYIGNNLSVDATWSHFFGQNSSFAFYRLPGADYFGLTLLYTFRLTNLQN